MKFNHAVNQAVQNNERVKITQGRFKPNNRVQIYVQPARNFDHTNDYLKRERQSKIQSIEESSEDASEYFVIQVEENVENKMSDIDFEDEDPEIETDVFDEEIFSDSGDAKDWLDSTGYFEQS